MDSKALQIKDLSLGKIDAKNELIDNSEKSKELFRSTFLIPDNIVIEDFENLRSYYILGLKGTGKTALLRYIATEVEKNKQASTNFVLFKSDFSNADKKDFSRAARTTIVDKDVSNYSGEDFSAVWRWFIYKEIIRSSEEENKHFFKYTIGWDKFKTCVTAPEMEDESSGFRRLLPKLKRGSVEVGGDIKIASAKLGLEFEWEDNLKTKIKFEKLVKQADELFRQQVKGDDIFYLFFDELELVYEKQKQYELDIKLIRDLVIAVNQINSIAIKNEFNIGVIAAVRSEVVNSIHASGKEINKPILDFGTTLSWNQKLDSSINHPLIQLIVKKIKASEQNKDVYRQRLDKQIWADYFPSMIFSQDAYEYLLHQGWYRPRDIIRILRVGQKQFPYYNNFNQKLFDSIRQKYSEECWIELVEELRTKYTESELDSIKKLLYGIDSPFTYHEINKKSEEKKALYPSLNKLLESKSLSEILSDLYRSGVLGNAGARVRFACRGDNDIILDKPMKIHNALWNYLAVENKKHKR